MHLLLNRLNFILCKVDNVAKYLIFHYETGAQVFFHVLSWLYQGKSPIEYLVYDLTCFKKIILDGDEEEKMIDELENGTIEICDLNLTLLYKITRSICGLLRNEKEHKQLWSKRCPSNEKAELEHRLFLLNDGQMSDKTITKSDLELILQQAGQRGGVDVQKINDAISMIHDDYELIYNDDTDESTKYDKCGSYIINTILPWLYKGKSTIKDLVIDLTKMKSIQVDATQKDVLDRLSKKEIELSDLDISFLFKIIQSVCGLPDSSEDVWKKKDELEGLILELKNNRNDVTHRYLQLKKNMSDSVFDFKADEMKSLLKSIIEKAKQKANIDFQEAIDAETYVENDIKRIRNLDKIDDSMKSLCLIQILKDLKASYEAKQRLSFENELDGYSAPHLCSINEESIHLCGSLTFEDQIMEIQGEAGLGKTSVTRTFEEPTDILKMNTIAKPFRNRENYSKCLALYFEPGLSVLLTTLEWCYTGQRPIEEYLADLGATNSLRKTNTIKATEQNILEELKEGKTNLNDLDITIIYKIIQLTCNLLPRNDVVWTKACPTSRQGELEFLLSQLKDGRNKLAHPRNEHKNITDPMVADPYSKFCGIIRGPPTVFDGIIDDKREAPRIEAGVYGTDDSSSGFDIQLMDNPSEYCDKIGNVIYGFKSLKRQGGHCTVIECGLIISTEIRKNDPR